MTGMTAGVNIRMARGPDVPAVASLINQAFAVEQFFKQGDRTTALAVSTLLDKGSILLAETDETLIGSVYVELRGPRVYIGLLAVHPDRQGGGIGRTLMTAAEDYGRVHGCSAVEITVVNLRTELPPFYHKLGYVETGTAAFDREEPTTRPCHFIVMSKAL